MSRADRVAELIKQEISDIMMKKIRDPRIGFASITEVELTEDLKIAKVYFSILGTDKQKEDSMHGLESACGYIKRELGSRLDLRDTPELIFRRDDSIERGAKVFAILNQLEKEKNLVKPATKRRGFTTSNNSETATILSQVSGPGRKKNAGSNRSNSKRK